VAMNNIKRMLRARTTGSAGWEGLDSDRWAFARRKSASRYMSPILQKYSPNTKA